MDLFQICQVTKIKLFRFVAELKTLLKGEK